MPTYKIALKLTDGDGALVPFIGAVASGTMTMTTVAGGTRIEGSITKVTASMALPVKLPAKFNEVVAREFPESGGVAFIPSRVGSVSVEWGDMRKPTTKITATLTPSGLAALLFKRAIFTGGAKRIADPVVVTPTPGAPQAPIGGDDIDVSKATMIGAHRGTNPAKAKITKKLKAVRISGTDSIRFEHEILGWPDSSPVGDNIDGRCYIYWRDGGTLTGGQFDWKRPASSGVSTKDTKNLHNGYLPTPATAAVLWFCLVSNDGRERTNVRQSSTLWGGTAAPAVEKPATTTPASASFPASVSEIVGVGLDYVWPGEDHEQLCRDLSAAGCTATGIELMGGWSRRSDAADVWKYGIASIRKPLPSLVAACRRHNILLYVAAMNDNKGLGKYGDDKTPASKFNGLVRDCMQLLMDQGPDGIWVNPVSETQSDYGRGIEREFMAKFNAAGNVTVNNNGSRPKKNGAGSTTHCYHTFKPSSDFGVKGGITNTDTGTAITSITNGGIYGATLKPGACAKFAAGCRKAGGRGCLVYTFTGMRGVPTKAIKAVGAAWRAG